jgi:hypothetical protein
MEKNPSSLLFNNLPPIYFNFKPEEIILIDNFDGLYLNGDSTINMLFIINNSNNSYTFKNN